MALLSRFLLLMYVSHSSFPWNLGKAPSKTICDYWLQVPVDSFLHSNNQIRSELVVVRIKGSRIDKINDAQEKWFSQFWKWVPLDPFEVSEMWPNMKALKAAKHCLLTKGEETHMGRGRWHFTRENEALVVTLHLQSSRFMINLHDGVLHFLKKAFSEGTSHVEQRLWPLGINFTQMPLFII